MKDDFSSNFERIEHLFTKIDYYFKHRDMWVNELSIEREDLIEKKYY